MLKYISRSNGAIGYPGISFAKAAMELTLVERHDKKALSDFVSFPLGLYAPERAFYVPPLVKNQQKMLSRGGGMQLSGGPYAMFAAAERGKIRGRVLAGVNRVKNRSKSTDDGYITLFECEDSAETASLLLTGAEHWLRAEGAKRAVGPVSPTNGDSLRGVLLDGFGSMPAINTAYTKSYYPALFESCGYKKHLDFFAYRLKYAQKNYERVRRIVDRRAFAMDLTIRPLDVRHIQSEARDIHSIFAEAARAEWEHLETPSAKQIEAEFSALKQFICPELILTARVAGKPAGFVAALPDYNEVLIKMGGRITPFSFFKFLKGKRNIRRVRAFMQFAVPKFQGTALMSALYLKLYENTLALGYEEIEGSTIAEMNLSSFGTLAGIGFELDRTYRMYQKLI